MAHKNIKLNNSTLKAIILVIICTFIITIGQVLLKKSVTNLSNLHNIITNTSLILGFVAYGFGIILLVMALKYGKLSVIYPFMALSFIWITFASIKIFNEHVSLFNWLGILLIIIGVSVISLGAEK